MGHLINVLFTPPSCPDTVMPLIARMSPSVRTGIQQAFELTYYRGVYDGLIAGVLISLLLIPSIRNRALKGAANVAQNL